MRTNVLLPQIELTMESAIIARWLVAVGDRVAADQPLIEVETQKATSDVPSPAAGFVRRLCVKEGDTVPEKALLCILTDGSDEPLGDEPTPAKASPAARRLAKELGVNLATLSGTGPDARITEEDVRSAAAPATAPPATAPPATAAQAAAPRAAAAAAVAVSSDEGETLPATRLALIAQMRRSLAEIPQIHLQRSLDVTSLAVKTLGITFTHRLIVAAAAALKIHPVLRTAINGDKVKVLAVSVAVAIESPHGLVAPVIRDADQLSLEQVADVVKDFRERADANTLKRDELTGATPFAVTNLGMFEVDQFDAFVFYGQTAVLSVGRSVDAPDGRKLAWVGLAVDHRVVDGGEAARFLQTLQAEIRKQ